MEQNDFGYLLRELRYERGETLEQVAEGTGLSVAMLSRMERGERLPSAESVRALAKHFGVSYENLMSESIVHHLVARYGRTQTDLAAERLRRLTDEPLYDDLKEDSPADTPAGERLSPATFGRGPVPDERPRAYGRFRAEPLSAALRNLPPGPAEKALFRAPPGDAPKTHSAPEPPGLGPGAASQLDPAVERMLEATEGSLDAALVLTRRELPSLPAPVRLRLVARIAALAEYPVDVLRALARDDADEKVRHAARQALERLERRR